MMQREVPYSIEGIGLVPDGFYTDAERVIETIPDEWDAIAIGPEFERNEDGWPTAYLGAGFIFVKGGKYVALLLESPSLFEQHGLDGRYLNKVRRAFEKAA